jgi:hypothetical protein
MPLEILLMALQSLRDWPTMIGIIGGEPLLHPEFKAINALLRKHFPRQKLGLWTSGLPGTDREDPRSDPDIQTTYGFVAFNPHDPEQVKKCRHQPLTVAINEAVQDREVMWKLIDNCWVQRTWCPAITHRGAYFCEVGGAQDLLLNDGANAWPIEQNWWRRSLDAKSFMKQKEALCPHCGMAIPMERELLLKNREKISPHLLQLFREKKLKRVRDVDVEVFDRVFSKDMIRENIGTWYPGNYREDLTADESAGEGRGLPEGFL